MRSSCCLAAAVLVSAIAVARADESQCLAAVKDLELKTAEDSEATWDERYEAYKTAKAQLEEDDYKLCALAYEGIRKKVADGLRRESVPLSGWLMGLFSAGLLWGGLSVCCWIAFRSGESGTEDE